MPKQTKTKQPEQKKTNQPVCPECGWTARVDYRIKTNDYICRRCGHCWPKT